MAAAKKEVACRTFNKKNSVGFMHPKARKFITANKDNELVAPKDGKEAVEMLERAVGAFRV